MIKRPSLKVLKCDPGRRERTTHGLTETAAALRERC